MQIAPEHSLLWRYTLRYMISSKLSCFQPARQGNAWAAMSVCAWLLPLKAILPGTSDEWRPTWLQAAFNYPEPHFHEVLPNALNYSGFHGMRLPTSVHEQASDPNHSRSFHLLVWLLLQCLLSCIKIFLQAPRLLLIAKSRRNVFPSWIRKMQQAGWDQIHRVWHKWDVNTVVSGQVGDVGHLSIWSCSLCVSTKSGRGRGERHLLGKAVESLKRHRPLPPSQLEMAVSWHKQQQEDMKRPRLTLVPHVWATQWFLCFSVLMLMASPALEGDGGYPTACRLGRLKGGQRRPTSAGGDMSSYWSWDLKRCGATHAWKHLCPCPDYLPQHRFL